MEEEDRQQQVIAKRRVRPLLGTVLILVLLVVGVPGINAALAPPDVPTPAGAERLAESVQHWFPRNMRTTFLTYRVAIREWNERGGAYLVRLEVHNLLFGLTPRTGYAITGCDWEQWLPDVAFSGGWADTDANLALVLEAWATVPDACP